MFSRRPFSGSQRFWINPVYQKVTFGLTRMFFIGTNLLSCVGTLSGLRATEISLSIQCLVWRFALHSVFSCWRFSRCFVDETASFSSFALIEILSTLITKTSPSLLYFKTRVDWFRMNLIVVQFYWWVRSQRTLMNMWLTPWPEAKILPTKTVVLLRWCS